MLAPHSPRAASVVAGADMGGISSTIDSAFDRRQRWEFSTEMGGIWAKPSAHRPTLTSAPGSLDRSRIRFACPGGPSAVNETGTCVLPADVGRPWFTQTVV